MKSLLQYLKGYKKECILGPLFKMLEACFDLTVPYVTALMIDQGIANHDTGRIGRYSVMLTPFCNWLISLVIRVIKVDVPT